MGIPKFMGIETEYNIYSNLASDATDLLINDMIGILKGERLGLDMRSSTPTRCFLKNGGLVYKDMGAPEYCTPECPDPKTLVLQDKAGELIVQELARKVSVLKGCEVAIHKKSSDGHGHTSGCHENYSVSPEFFLHLTRGDVHELRIRAWATFLALRQIIVGGGKVGSEFSGATCPFQISQRADFIVAFRNNDTLSDRPVIQCRDEALADQRLVRRLHVIVGDANMCEWPILLKSGLSALMLMALESNFFEHHRPPVINSSIPKVIRSVSRDMGFVKHYETEAHQSISAIDILFRYTEILTQFLENERPEYLSDVMVSLYFDVLEKAGYILSRLKTGDMHSLFGICDWVTKLVLAEKFVEKKSKTLQDCVGDHELRTDLVSYVDMAYSSTDTGVGLYHALNKRGLTKRLVTDEEVSLALESPPQGRAAQRTALLEKFNQHISRIEWEKITLKGPTEEYPIELPTPFGYSNEQVLKDALAQCNTPQEFFERRESFRN